MSAVNQLLQNEPPCIVAARVSLSLEGLLALAQFYKDKVDGLQLALVLQNYIDAASDACADWISDSKKISEVLEKARATTFTCEYMKMQGFCTDIEESQCPYRTNPAEKLKIFTRQCILFENSGELSLKINNYKAVVKISGKSGLIIHKKDKNGTVQYIPNTPLITSIYISAFREIPARDISDSEALDLINHWLSKAGRIVVEDEDDLILQEVVDIIVSGEYDIYKLELLKTGELTTVDGFFSDGKNIYIETNFLRQILEQHGITISRRKLVKPLKRVLAVKGSKLERVGEKRYRFWIFNIQAIKQCVKDDVEWEPQILEKPPSFDDLLDSDVVGGEGAESLDSVDEGVDDSSTGGDDGGTTECAKEDVYDNLEEDWDSSL